LKHIAALKGGCPYFNQPLGEGNGSYIIGTAVVQEVVIITAKRAIPDFFDGQVLDDCGYPHRRRFPQIFRDPHPAAVIGQFHAKIRHGLGEYCCRGGQYNHHKK
jgi:hypothetical protein